jgi:hypothetical protein
MARCTVLKFQDIQNVKLFRLCGSSASKLLRHDSLRQLKLSQMPHLSLLGIVAGEGGALRKEWPQLGAQPAGTSSFSA